MVTPAIARLALPSTLDAPTVRRFSVAFDRAATLDIFHGRGYEGKNTGPGNTNHPRSRPARGTAGEDDCGARRSSPARSPEASESRDAATRTLSRPDTSPCRS